jgi:hypothetical protein
MFMEMVNDNSGVMVMREGIGIWNEILIVYKTSCSTLQMYSDISCIEDYLVILTLGVWCNVMGKNLVNSTNIYL